MTPPTRTARLLAEFLGTAFLIIAVVGSGIMASRLSPTDIGLQLFENAAATAGALVGIAPLPGPVGPELPAVGPVGYGVVEDGRQAIPDPGILDGDDHLDRSFDADVARHPDLAWRDARLEASLDPPVATRPGATSRQEPGGLLFGPRDLAPAAPHPRHVLPREIRAIRERSA